MLERIGRYRVRRRIGSGAFATVWLADDESLAAPVAIKVLAENWSDQLDVRARFTREAQLMRRADSDRLVRVLDVGELPDGRPYLVMPYAAGGTLADRLTGGPLPVVDAVHIAAEVARGVAALHESGAIHRDLKPSNVLFTGPPDERVVVADLGLAKAIAHASGFTVVAGSPAYMAPEQSVPGGGLTVRADVYAIGALLYAMLTGLPPSTPLIPPSHRVRGIPPRLDRAVLRALAPAPADRWPSATSFAAALDGVFAPAPRRPRRGRIAGPAVAALVLAALAAAGLRGSVATAGDPWVRVADASGTVSVAVPDAWARQAKDAGWDPSAIGLPPGHAPGVLVGPDLAAWGDPASPVPGAFAGRSPALADGGSAPALPQHGGCTREPDRAQTIGSFAATIARWDRCDGGPIAFDEVVLRSPTFGLYVQIKQVDANDRTTAILNRLRAS
jgi:eukaryotic-like serine/threonine-protein kinase